MDQAVLVGFDIGAGSRVISTLDEAGIKPKIAMWVAFPDHEDGRLVLSSPALDQSNTMHAYQQVARSLQGKFEQMPPPILIFPTRSPFVKALRQVFGPTRSVEGMRLGGQTIGDRFVSDAYVYRIQ